ncbi:MAG: PD-(D/E)XK nuclease family protein [Gammaproteobacteria bacterium]|nr:PD-(D/E)XK nuclease family protein [Gammaproteobacteria bacterium]
MYDWLPAALGGTSTVITANRRLARVLKQEFARRQVDAGVLAWPSPRIFAWPDWLDAQLRDAGRQEDLPTRINAYHSTLLWDRCLRRELGEEAVGVGNLVRLARDSWQRLSDWDISIRDVARAALSPDHKAFAAAAGRYVGLLQRESWSDDAGLAALVAKLITDGEIAAAGRYTFAGFDREKPSATQIRLQLVEARCSVSDAPVPVRSGQPDLVPFATKEDELRAAGDWARARLQENPEQYIAIVANGLDRDAARMAGLVREGLMPGYRLSPTPLADALNVSYGRRLSSYPLISIGLLWLRWLVRDLRATEVSQLLRSPLIVAGPGSGRARLELRLRRLPDRHWSPSMITSALQGKDESPDASEWLQRVAAITKNRRDLTGAASPAHWAVTVDEVLKAAGWPGKQRLRSAEFQAVNRWRDLLNDLARMDLVSARMSLETALNQLESMAADAVFQPESEHARVHLMGPLEASGLEFDALWLTGVTAAQWPPAGNPSALVSRRLQEQHGMPDATPDDTVAYARRLLGSLCAAAPVMVCSYPLTEDDAEQTPSDLLPASKLAAADAFPAPGLFAASMAGTASLVDLADRVPPIGPDEPLSGGAGTIQNQLTDPIAAFLGGRLGVRALDEQTDGLPALLRGNLIHDALYQLYIEKPSRDDIQRWTDCEHRIAGAIDFAFGRHERHADRVLLALLAMERRRVAGLLHDFIAIDIARDAFIVDSVERSVEFAEAGVRLKLRVDRIDRLPDDGIAILDYKTGAEKKFLTAKGEPKEIQLVAYACAVDEPVAALALVNVDSRTMGFNGAGTGYTNPELWPEQLVGWSNLVRSACIELTAGDVRMNMSMTMADARPLNLLTRFTELRSDI